MCIGEVNGFELNLVSTEMYINQGTVFFLRMRHFGNFKLKRNSIYSLSEATGVGQCLCLGR